MKLNRTQRVLNRIKEEGIKINGFKILNFDEEMLTYIIRRGVGADFLECADKVYKKHNEFEDEFEKLKRITKYPLSKSDRNAYWKKVLKDEIVLSNKFPEVFYFRFTLKIDGYVKWAKVKFYRFFYGNVADEADEVDGTKIEGAKIKTFKKELENIYRIAQIIAEEETKDRTKKGGNDENK